VAALGNDEAGWETSAMVVSALSGSLDYVKEVRDKCAAAGIPAMAAAPAPGRG
jgi:hypothetical protein